MREKTTWQRLEDVTVSNCLHLGKAPLKPIGFRS
jgi:hypothetical protein